MCPECDGTGKVEKYGTPERVVAGLFSFGLLAAPMGGKADCSRCGGSGEIDD